MTCDHASGRATCENEDLGVVSRKVGALSFMVALRVRLRHVYMLEGADTMLYTIDTPLSCLKAYYNIP